MNAFIWDLDGTLLDSYDAIIAAIGHALATTHYPFDKEAIRKQVLATSVQNFFQQIEKETGQNLKPIYQKVLPKYTESIHLLEGARDILNWAQDEGISQFVFTHKDKEAHKILKK